MIDTVTKVLLLILIVIEIVVMLYLFYINMRRHQEDKKFWKQLSDAIDETMNKYNKDYTSEQITSGYIENSEKENEKS